MVYTWTTEHGQAEWSGSSLRRHTWQDLRKKINWTEKSNLSLLVSGQGTQNCQWNLNQLLNPHRIKDKKTWRMRRLSISGYKKNDLKVLCTSNSSATLAVWHYQHIEGFGFTWHDSVFIKKEADNWVTCSRNFNEALGILSHMHCTSQMGGS